MAEILCPHCRAAVPPDGVFCPRCRSLVSSAGDQEAPQLVAAVPAGHGAGPGGGAATDVVEEAVRSSMATSPGRSVDLLAEDQGPAEDQGRADSHRRSTSQARPAGPSSPQNGPRSPLTRVIVWLVALPRTVRAVVRGVGGLPAAVLVVVFALLGSGGLLYAVGAFEETAARPKPPQTAAGHLSPSSYKASCAADPSVDAAGDKVTFGAKHLFDGRTRTAWRCAGNGSGQQVTLSFGRPVTVTEVALVPGWATRDETSNANRFAENGAPRAVTWHFDETSTTQRIDRPRPVWERLTLKSPVRTATVTLTIDAIREGNRRTTVAVSEVRIEGRE